MQRFTRGSWVLLIVGVAAIVAWSARAADRVPPPEVTGTEAYRYVHPASQIISYRSGVGLLDTRTGAIYELRGDLDNPSATKHWVLDVPAVKGPTSGLLEIQRAEFEEPQAIFLVDMATGRTWLLGRRARDGHTTTWQSLDMYR